MRCHSFWTGLVILVFGWTGVSLSTAEAQAVSSPQALPAQTIEYEAREQTLTVHLNGMPLRQAMDELSKQTHIRFRPPAQAQTFDSRPVTVSFERLPLERAIKQLLGPSNTAMIYGPPQSGHGAQPVLAEVRVLDVGVIPITATVSTAAETGVSIPPPRPQLTLQEIQANRAAKGKKTDKKQGRQDKRGGRSNNRSSTDAQPQKSDDQQPASDSAPASSDQSNKQKSNQKK